MPEKLRSFQDVLAAAIADLTDNGFDSMERVERWTRELRMAAERSLVSAASLEEQLRDGLAAIYRRMVDRGGILRFNPGVERYTLEKVKPMLRSELDRRIRASAELIRLNRSEAIEKTLRRFQGWSTSIPVGGVSAETRAEVRKTVRKSLASLPFEERRVLVDQGHKLVAAVNDIVATDGGAIAARWNSHWRQAGYDYREDHKELDGKVFLIRDSWAHRAGLVKKDSRGYVDEIVQPAVLPFCRCFFQYLYALRDLPETMLTALGKASLARMQGAEEVRSARFARGDAAAKATQAEAGYVGPTETGERPAGLMCAMCGMYEVPATCSAVEGKIQPGGWCTFFELRGIDARADAIDLPHGGSSVPVPVDRDHDVPWMFVLERNAKRLYADRTLPRSLTLKATTFDPAELGWEHEIGEWLLMMKLIAAFIEEHGRQPTEAERAAIYDVAHERGGIPREKEAAKRLGVDWDAWEAWSRGKLASLEKRDVSRQVPDPHVKPLPAERNQPMAAVA